MFESLLLAAAAAAAGVPVEAEPRSSPAQWVRASDLPRSVGEASVTTFDLTIDPSGRPIHCTVIIASGSSSLDAAVCAAVMKRARFRPAHDEAGSPVPSVRRDRVIWLPNRAGGNSWHHDADIVVSVPTIAEAQPGLVDVVVVIDGTGAVGECFIAESPAAAELQDLACAAVRNPAVSQPIKDAEGNVLRGVRSFHVAFKPGEATGIELR